MIGMPQIWTSHWHAELPSDFARVGISRGARGQRGYRRCIPLQPGPWWRSASEAEFCHLYQTQLARLDPELVIKTLAAQSGGRSIGLLCWEHPGDGTWCHRALAAYWLHSTLGLEVREYDLPGVGLQHPMMAPSLRC